MKKLTYDELKATDELELGNSEWIVVDQDRINRFADVTEDRQWIHVDEERAKSTEFGSTIAHGYLTASLMAHFIKELVEVTDASMTINYGLDKLRFRTPVLSGKRVRGKAKIVAVNERAGGLLYRLRIAVEVEGEKRPALTSEVLFLAFR